ncbi:MAG TPA: hypothetical protein VNN80_08290 [Polyangiaceae bacterium]|nr:hypothetical protein [Polyangiaceae bacterium]
MHQERRIAPAGPRAAAISRCRGRFTVTPGEPLASAELGGACTGLSSESALCALAGGACRCSLRREEQRDDSGVYGVLLPATVAINGSEGQSRVDYCVEGDVLHWQQPESEQHLVLRRVPQR